MTANARSPYVATAVIILCIIITWAGSSWCKASMWVVCVWLFICVCLSIRMSVCPYSNKENRLELSTSKLLDTYCMAGRRPHHSPCGQNLRLQDYEMHYHITVGVQVSTTAHFSIYYCCCCVAESRYKASNAAFLRSPVMYVCSCEWLNLINTEYTCMCIRYFLCVILTARWLCYRVHVKWWWGVCCIKGGIIAVGITTSSQRSCDSGSECVVTATYVMSPLLVVAYAIAGTIAVDFTTEPLGKSCPESKHCRKKTDNLLFRTQFNQS